MRSQASRVCVTLNSQPLRGPCYRTIHTFPPFRRKLPIQQRRPFSNSLSPSQTLNASRILPYHAKDIFNIIADVGAYKHFIPYLQSSTVLTTSSQDPVHQRQWPHTAELRIGYSGYEENFNSNVYCVPYKTLEAVSGDAEPTIARSVLSHYLSDDPDEPLRQNRAGEGSIFSSLLTRWTFHEYPFKPSPPDGPPQEGNANKRTSSPRTDVNLHIEVTFANPVYAALSQAVAPKVAGMIVEAFEKRAKEVLGEGDLPIGDAEKDADSKSSLQGVVRNS